MVERDPAEREAFARLAHDEAHRALAEQRAAIESIRTRAYAVLSTGSIVTGFGAGFLAGGVDLNSTALSLALVGYVLVVGSSMAASWPLRGWKASNNAIGVLKWEGMEEADIIKALRQLATGMQKAWTSQEKTLEWRQRLLVGASIALAGQVGFWVWVISTTRTMSFHP